MVKLPSIKRSLDIIYPMGVGELLASELIERLLNRDVDMYRSYFSMRTVDDSLVNQTFAMPSLFVMKAILLSYIIIRCNDGKIYASVDHVSKDVGLWHGLSILLSNPSFRSVGRDEDDGKFLVIGFHYSRIQVCQSRA